MHASLGDTLLLMVPTVGLLIIGVLRLDEHLFATDTKGKPDRFKPRFSNFDEHDDLALADPDGRISRPERK